MSRQNVYDDERFFEGYARLQKNSDSANNLEEKPVLFSLLGSIQGKSVLDMGCGYGENCRAFSEEGALRVLGIDISKKMLAVARKENGTERIDYRRLTIEEVSSLNETFDVVVSSLAVHYVEDFGKLARDVYALLNDGGLFVFSQEHPLTTAPLDGAQWVRDEEGQVDHYRLTDYARSGKRSVSWIVDGVIKYHRSFSELINSLTAAGFRIEEMKEPVPSPEMMRRFPYMAKDIHKPNFLFLKARKPD